MVDFPLPPAPTLLIYIYANKKNYQAEAICEPYGPSSLLPEEVSQSLYFVQPQECLVDRTKPSALYLMGSTQRQLMGVTTMTDDCQ
jgi:hypothetical protein